MADPVNSLVLGCGWARWVVGVGSFTWAAGCIGCGGGEVGAVFGVSVCLCVKDKYKNLKV